MSDLKPCPFCGSEPVTSPPPDSYDAYWHIYCAKCDDADFESPGSNENYDKAVASWNRRAPRFSVEEREAMKYANVLIGQAIARELMDTRIDNNSTVALARFNAVIRKMLEEK